MKSADAQASINLRHAFVAMLFALAAARVAESSVDILIAAANGADVGAQIVASLSHIALAVVVITTSWVQWSRSTLKASPIGSVFERGYVLLVLDVFLVIIYYALASTAERLDGTVSPKEEIYSLYAIMLVYLVWDAITNFDEWESKGFVEFGRHVFSSFITVAVITVHYLIYRFMATANDGVSTPSYVIAVDASLLLLVFLFRAQKRIEGHATVSAAVLSAMWAIQVVAITLCLALAVGTPALS